MLFLFGPRGEQYYQVDPNRAPLPAYIGTLGIEIIDLQTKYFGPTGDYIQQKNNLLKPIQDQVLSIVRQIAQERKYDFVFDRSSDLVMLYSAKNYDISNLVLQRINAQERIKARKKQIEERKAQIEQRKKN